MTEMLDEDNWNECDICGEYVAEGQRAEMYDPDGHHEDEHIFCHDQCGIEQGLEVA